MKQEQVLLHSDTKDKSNLKFPPTTLKPVISDTKKRQHLLINECNAAEKIESYPLNIQKLVWRALYYKSELRTRKTMFLRGHEQDRKLIKYIDAFRHAQQLIFRMCKKNNLKVIILEDKFKNTYEVK